MEAPHQILTAAQMQTAEEALIAQGETVESLMECAGAGAADWIWRVAAGRAVTVLCGPGNNGGDGYVIARVLAERGLEVNVVAPIEPGTEAARTARGKWGGEPVASASGAVLVDCLFGTGLSRPLSDELVHLLMNLAVDHPLRVAVDLPSGVQSDTGGLLNRRLPRFDLTIALGAWKRAHWLMPASAQLGERRLVDIGVGKVDKALQLANPPSLSPPRADAHKYSRGLLLVVGGAMPGAAVLAAHAAQRAGAGYVKLASKTRPADLPADIVHAGPPGAELFGDDARIAAMLVGPGLGRDDGARETLRAALAAKRPLVLDADALSLLEPADGPFSNILVTPHEGELETLCKNFGVTRENKLERAEALQEETGMTVLAKGPDNILVGASGTTLFPPASSWLSTAGSGDVLAGIAVARLASGPDPEQAAIEAVALHSQAACHLQTSFSATDLISAIPMAYRSYL